MTNIAFKIALNFHQTDLFIYKQSLSTMPYKIFKHSDAIVYPFIPYVKGTVHTRNIFLKYVMLRIVTRNSTIIIMKYIYDIKIGK